MAEVIPASILALFAVKNKVYYFKNKCGIDKTMGKDSPVFFGSLSGELAQKTKDAEWLHQRIVNRNMGFPTQAQSAALTEHIQANSVATDLELVAKNYQRYSSNVQKPA